MVQPLWMLWVHVRTPQKIKLGCPTPLHYFGLPCDFKLASKWRNCIQVILLFLDIRGIGIQLQVIFELFVYDVHVVNLFST